MSSRPRTHRLSPTVSLGGRQGFTMVELLVAMVLMLVVMGAIFGIWFGLQRAYTFTEDDMSAQQQARSALAEMVELIRTARQPDSGQSEDLSEDLRVVIVEADKNSLTLWTDVDRDPDHTLELVRFRVDTGTRTLYRDTDSSPPYDPTFATAASVRLVSDWVSNDGDSPLFSYVGADGLPMQTPVVDVTFIREVVIDLRIDVYEKNRPIAHHLRSVVQPRNLRQY